MRLLHSSPKSLAPPPPSLHGICPESNKHTINKSPGGLNAHLWNWRKLPLVHIGVLLPIRKAMEALPLVTFYIGPPPQPATPRRGHWGHPGNLPRTIFILHLRRSITHYNNFTVLSLTGSGEEVWNLQRFGPWGPPPWAPMVATCTIWITFESPAPEDDSCQVWLKSNHAFLQEVDEQLLFI